MDGCGRRGMVAVIVFGLTSAVLVGIWRGRTKMADLQPGLEVAGRTLGILTGFASLGIGLVVLDLIDPSDPYLSTAIGAGLVAGVVVLTGASATPVRSRIVRGAMVAGWMDGDCHLSHPFDVPRVPAPFHRSGICIVRVDANKRREFRSGSPGDSNRHIAGPVA